MLNPQKTSTNIWFNEKMNRWNWVLITDKDGVTEMHTGNADTKEQSKLDINKTLVWIDETSQR